MNEIMLDGIIWGIQDSHTVGDIQYQKANITVKNSNGSNSVLSLQFKKFQCPYKDNEKISISGNIRSYSKKITDLKNKVNIYVYTYFDSGQEGISNHFQVTGRICKLNDMRFLENGKNNLHFIFANNIMVITMSTFNYKFIR